MSIIRRLYCSALSKSLYVNRTFIDKKKLQANNHCKNVLLSRIAIKSTPLSCYVTESSLKFQDNIYYKVKYLLQC